MVASTPIMPARCYSPAKLPENAKMRRVDVAQRTAGRAARSIGTRHRVIHQRAGQQLPGARLVDAMLPQRLADTLRDAAVTLAVKSWFERGAGSMGSWAENTHLDVLPGDQAGAALIGQV
jgi:hypothetical protein